MMLSDEQREALWQCCFSETRDEFVAEVEPLVEQWIREAMGAVLAAHRCDDQAERAYRRAARAEAEAERLRAQVTDLRHEASQSSMHRTIARLQATEERDWLTSRIERVRATLDPEDADPINDAYARGFAHHSRQVREALEGTDEGTDNN